MAVTTGIYYHDLGTWHGKYYRLYFYPASTSNLTTDDLAAPVQFPHNFIKSHKLTAGYADDIPFGQQLLTKLELEININSLSSALKTYIMTSETATEVVAYVDWNSANKSYKVPNRWRVLSSDTGDFTDITVKVIFEGVQERMKQYTYKPDGSVTLSVYDILGTILRNMSIDDIGHEINVNIVSPYIIDEIIYWRYTNLGHDFHVSNSSTDWDANYIKYGCMTIESLLDYILLYASNILLAYRRQQPGLTSTVYCTNYPTSHWRFYRQDYTDYNTYSTLIDNDDLFYINSIFINGSPNEIVGGCMSETESEGSWGKEFKNCHNLLKAIGESFLCKIKYYYDTDGIIYIINSPILTDYDKVGSTNTTLAVNAQRIVSDWEIVQGTEYEQSDCHITNANEEDIVEFPVKNRECGQDEGSIEVKNILHNQFCNARMDKFTDDHKKDWFDGTLSRLPIIATVTQVVLYKDLTLDASQIRIVKVSEACTVYLDGTIDESVLLPSMDAYFTFYDGSSLIDIAKISKDYYLKMGLERSVGAIGWLTSYVLNKYLCTKKQALITFKSDARYFSFTDLGKPVLIDFDGILGYTGAPFETNNPNGIITSIEMAEDGFLTIKAFIRGD